MREKRENQTETKHRERRQSLPNDSLYSFSPNLLNWSFVSIACCRMAPTTLKLSLRRDALKVSRVSSIVSLMFKTSDVLRRRGRMRGSPPNNERINQRREKKVFKFKIAKIRWITSDNRVLIWRPMEGINKPNGKKVHFNANEEILDG